MESSQFLMIFLAIGMLMGGIIVSETSYMFGIDNYLTKLSNKYNKEINKVTYCKFDGMQKIKSATSLILLFLICTLFDIIDLKTIVILLFIWAIFDIILFYNKRKKFVNQCPSKQTQY